MLSVNLSGRRWSHGLFFSISSHCPPWGTRTGLAILPHLHICFPLNKSSGSSSSYNFNAVSPWGRLGSWKQRLISHGDAGFQKRVRTVASHGSFPLISNLALPASTTVFSLSHLPKPKKPVSKGPFITRPLPPHLLH